MKRIIYVLVLTLLITSCSNEKRELSINFVFDKPVVVSSAKYPSYFQEIAIPFTTINGIDYLPKPINICRLDISNKIVETNAWYFKDMGENTVEFSKGWLTQYFKDSNINSYLTEPSKKSVTLEDWISKNKDSLFIYSEESELKEFNGKLVFNNTKELCAKIQELANGNLISGITILVNPNLGETQNINIGNSDNKSISPNDAGNEGVGKEIKDALMAIGNGNNKIQTERESLANEFIEKYMSNETKIDLKDGKTGFKVNAPPAKDYIFMLANEHRNVTDIKLFNLTYSNKHNGKILYVEIQETDN